MVREESLSELFNSEEIQKLQVLFLSSSEAVRVMTKFRGQVVRTELKDFILIDGRFISAIHITEEGR